MSRLGICAIFGPERGKTKVFSLHRSRKNVKPFCKLTRKWAQIEQRGEIYTYDIDATYPIDAIKIPGFEFCEYGKLYVGIPPKPRRRG